MDNYAKVPNELKSLGQWVCWQAQDDPSRPGKIKKLPINAITGQPARSNDPATWTTFDRAVEASKNFSGIGFMFANGYFGVDIDDAENAIEDFRNGSDDNIIGEFIHTLASYAEYSVSGKGLHIICRGSLPKGGRRRGKVEMYESGRFFIVTGHAASEYLEVADCTESVKTLHTKYIGGSTPVENAAPIRKPVELSDGEIIAIAEKSQQGTRFMNLMAGRWEGEFDSQSDADMSLASMLAFWFGRDIERMDRVFRVSGLMRDKWDRRQAGTTYGRRTLERAASTCREIFEPKEDYAVKIGSAKPEKPAKRKTYSFDDTGNAERMVDMFGGEIRYNYADGKNGWLYFDKKRWRQDDTGVIRKCADEVVIAIERDEGLYQSSEEVEKAYRAHLKKSRSNAAKTAMIKETEHRVAIVPSALDADPTLVNTPGGVYDIEHDSTRDHDPKLFLSRITGSEFSGKADCPLWQSFLMDIFGGDEELIRYVQKAAGYTLTGSIAEQCMFILYGMGRNGKSTFVGTLAAIMGDYAVNVQPETVMVGRTGSGGGATSDIARLKGARMVTTVEPNEGMRLNEGLIKQMTGGDRITARKLYGDEFEFDPEFKIWMSTNHKPVIRGTDTGIWRRLHLIPFMQTIPEEKVDKKLKYKLVKEYPAILAWMIEGARLWKKDGLKMPGAVREAVREYKNEMDVISAFLEQCTTPAPMESVRASELYQAYASWAETNGEYRMSNTRFGREMCKRYEKGKRSVGLVYTGITLDRNPDGYYSKRSYGVIIGGAGQTK